MTLAMGLRTAQGVFVVPLSLEHNWPLAIFSTALAVQNLLWGLIQPLIGMAADLLGAGAVIAVGSLVFAAGLWVLTWASDPLTVTVAAGVGLALGLSAASFPVILAVVARSVGPARRDLAMGLVIAGGSVGQVVLPPISGWLLVALGTTGEAFSILALVALAMVPLAWPLGERGRGERGGASNAGHGRMSLASLLPELRQAWARPDYRLTVLGFFACGFQLAFLSVHLPGYLSLCGLPSQTGANALGLVGLFNIIGCWASGVLASRWPVPRLLAALYLTRALSVAVFLACPVTQASVVGFSAMIGLTWLATVPLTSGLVVRMFGPGSLGLLFGFAFLSHQVGSFFGAWLGGVAVDLTGSYDAAWIMSGLLALVAAGIHLAIDDRPMVVAVGHIRH
jgi:predicted MFS family arabinose efflux permease